MSKSEMAARLAVEQSKHVRVVGLACEGKVSLAADLLENRMRSLIDSRLEGDDFGPELNHICDRLGSQPAFILDRLLTYAACQRVVRISGEDPFDENDYAKAPKGKNEGIPQPQEMNP
jgi:hypothetical protein